MMAAVKSSSERLQPVLLVLICCGDERFRLVTIDTGQAIENRTRQSNRCCLGLFLCRLILAVRVGANDKTASNRITGFSGSWSGTVPQSYGLLFCVPREDFVCLIVVKAG